MCVFVAIDLNGARSRECLTTARHSFIYHSLGMVGQKFLERNKKNETKPIKKKHKRGFLFALSKNTNDLFAKAAASAVIQICESVDECERCSYYMTTTIVFIRPFNFGHPKYENLHENCV